ncbi:MAG: Kelch repeat-containing protein [Bacteroidota bacterium]
MRSRSLGLMLIASMLAGCPSGENGGGFVLPGFTTPSKPTPTPSGSTAYPTVRPTAGPSPTPTPQPIPSYAGVEIAGGNPTNAWLLSEPMSTLRAGLSALPRDGKIIAFEGDGFSTIEEYVPSARMWTAKQFGASSRYFAVAGILNGKLYEAGGNNGQYDLWDVREYDFATGSSKILKNAYLPTLPGVHDAEAPTADVCERSHAGGGVLLIDNRQALCIAGGEVGNALVAGRVQRAVLIQFATYFPPTQEKPDGEWILAPDLPLSRSAMGAAVVDNRLYLLGGYTSDESGNLSLLSSMIRFDAFQWQWTPMASMSKPRHSFMTAVLNGKIYAIGGAGADNTVLRDVEEYDPATNRWRTLAPMPTARAMGAAVALNDRIYVLGGYTLDAGLMKPLRTVEVLFP